MKTNEIHTVQRVSDILGNDCSHSGRNVLSEHMVSVFVTNEFPTKLL